MHLIGLAGPAGAGKDALAEALSRRHGWHAFSFSDALYAEVASAYGISEAYLRQPDTKEAATARLALTRCADEAFPRTLAMGPYADEPIIRFMTAPRSPRWILQRWGTDYRRAQDPLYWVRRAAETLESIRQIPPAFRCPGLANTSARFLNEVRWLRREGGTIVHLCRPGVGAESDYPSERPVPIRPGDLQVSNRGTLADLDLQADQLVATLEQRAGASA